jgi:Transposase domain (DUF772)
MTANGTFHLVALVLYAYAVGVTTSRAIERRCVDDLAFRVITADRQPDHATIARFLVGHREGNGSWTQAHPQRAPSQEQTRAGRQQRPTA